MRTLGYVLMIAAALGLVAAAVAAGYDPNFGYRGWGRQWGELLRSGDWRAFQSRHLKFFDEHSVWTVFVPLLLLAVVGWVVRHFG